MWKTRIGKKKFFSFHPRILVLSKTGTGEFSFCGKPKSENFFFFLSENSRFVETESSGFVENGNWRILVLWKTRIGEFFFFFFYPTILVFWKRRILVLWKTGTGEFSFCGKPESENFFLFFFLSENSRFVETENSRFVENGTWRIFFFFFYPRIPASVENQNRRNFLFFFPYPRILVFWKTGIEEFFFFFLSERSRFVENGNWGNFFFFFIRVFSFCGKPESEKFFFFFIREFSFC